MMMHSPLVLWCLRAGTFVWIGGATTGFVLDWQERRSFPYHWSLPWRVTLIVCCLVVQWAPERSLASQTATLLLYLALPALALVALCHAGMRPLFAAMKRAACLLFFGWPRQLALALVILALLARHVSLSGRLDGTDSLLVALLCAGGVSGAVGYVRRALHMQRCASLKWREDSDDLS